MAAIDRVSAEYGRFSAQRQLLGQGFTVLVVGTGLLALKIISVGGVVVTASALTAPLCFFVFVLMGEVYSYAAARRTLYQTVLFCVLLAGIMEVVALLPEAMLWPGSAGMQAIQNYAPFFLFATAASILAAQSCMTLALRFGGTLLWRHAWLRLFVVPFIGQLVEAPLKITLCYYRWIAPGQLGTLLAGRLVAGVIVGGLALAPLYAMATLLRRVEARDALHHAARTADVVTAQQEARSLAIADTLKNGVLIVDDKSTICYANPAAAALFGYTVLDLTGQPLGMIQPNLVRSRHVEAVRHYAHTPDIAATSQPALGLHRDGHLIPVEISYLRYHKGGRTFLSAVLAEGRGNGTGFCGPAGVDSRADAAV